MKNLAEKHLSKYGRFGDTEMYQTSKTGPGKGKLWHVNPDEKALMDMYGQRGEKLVDLIGSGTINPVTGKEEKFVPILMAGLAAGQLGLSLYQGYKGTDMERDQAKQQEKLITDQLGALSKSEVALGEQASSQRKLITAEAERDYGKFSEISGRKIGDILKQSSEISGKTGFAYSGEVETIQREGTEQLRKDADFQREGMMGEYGKALGEVTGMYESEMSRIKSERDRLEAERKLSKQKSNSKFLGLF